MAIASTQSLERARLAWRRSPLPGFLQWWGSELTAMLPARLRGWVQRGPDVLWLSAAGDSISVYRVRTGSTLTRIPAELPPEVRRAAFAQACAGIDPDDRRLLLVVPSDHVLQRRLVLPAAAAGDPRRVAGYELDRQTPFKADQVYFDARLSGEPAPAGNVAVDLFVVPKAELDPMLERVGASGVLPDAIDVQGADGALAGIDLLPPGRRPRRADRRRRLNWLLGGVCIVLVVLLLSQWLDNRRAALAAMQAEVDTMRAQATRSEQLHAQLTGAIAASKFLVKRKADNPAPLAVLDDLTMRLPLTASLDTLTLDDSGGLDIKGEAAKAAALVDALGRSPLLAEPKLQGVIQPDPATGKERFEMVARVRSAETPDAH
ncbi:MAG TPA: PilN domain-containing protein [Rhodanobacteraceae bacterium]|nr:PilN domain-containing protein [Rhodanobacteraceae bacterium]